MAMADIFTCTHCAREFFAWDEGLPWVRKANGRKQYVPHPHPLSAEREGTDVASLCLGCGRESMRDTKRRTKHCRVCGGHEVVPYRRLAGKRCQFCAQGTFARQDGWVIS